MSRALAEHGFTLRGSSWTRGEHEATLQQGWLVLSAPVAEGDLDPLQADADWRGLWRLVPTSGGSLARVFELPPTLLTQFESSPDEHATALATLDWALSSAGNAGLQPGSSLPLRPLRSLRLSSALGRTERRTAENAEGAEEENKWTSAEPGWSPAFPAESIVRSGAVVAQVRALRDGPAFDLPLTTRPSTTLHPGRLSWLRALLSAGRTRWRLARCLALDGLPSARVDLRGAPPELLEPLTAAALDALRQVGAWLLEPLDLVLDPSLDSPALDAGAPAPVRSPRRARPASTRRARPAPSQENLDGSLDDSSR
jgi:hypothetical protein